MQQLEQLSQEHDDEAAAQQLSPAHGRMYNRSPAKKAEISRQEEFWDCPICGRAQPADDRALNAHVDLCLSRQAIREVAREGSNSDIESGRGGEVRRSAAPSGRKRGRPGSDGRRQADGGRLRKKPFFAARK